MSMVRLCREQSDHVQPEEFFSSREAAMKKKAGEAGERMLTRRGPI
jgi:hypothetical protein